MKWSGMKEDVEWNERTEEVEWNGRTEDVEWSKSVELGKNEREWFFIWRKMGNIDAKKNVKKIN